MRKHILTLAGIVAIAIALRFTCLDLKPLWLDEIITALFALGKGIGDVPLEVLFGVGDLNALFTLERVANCGDIARNLALESTHPPLFFCLTHDWLKLSGNMHSLAWQLRALPAIAGVMAVVATYALGQAVGSVRLGLLAAALMAVSPFAVYLSQEARHYTLPLALVTLSLVAFVTVHRDLAQGDRPAPGMLLLWIAANSIGLYVHYFMWLAIAAQVATLLTLWYWEGRRGGKYTVASNLLALISALLPLAVFLPWLWIMSNHVGRSETDWMQPFNPSWTDNLAPIYQTLLAWVSMFVGLPVENQPLWIAIPAGAIALLFTLWLVRQIAQGIKILLHPRLTPSPYSPHLTEIGIFILWMLLAFAAIAYGLGKDITTAPRYHFPYYPAVVVLVAASLQAGKSRRTVAIALGLGLLSSLLVVGNLVFQKPYYPERVARDMLSEGDRSLMLVVGYENLQEVALGLSYALAWTQNASTVDLQFAFFQRHPGYQPVWQHLAQLPAPSYPVNTWIVAPGLRQREYPPELSLGGMPCRLDPEHYYRIGIPYQLYRCSNNNVET